VIGFSSACFGISSSKQITTDIVSGVIGFSSACFKELPQRHIHHAHRVSGVIGFSSACFRVVGMICDGAFLCPA